MSSKLEELRTVQDHLAGKIARGDELDDLEAGMEEILILSPAFFGIDCD